MRTSLHLKPGRKGIKQLLAQYGDRLVCVRYRYDAQQKKRFKTVELIVAEWAWELPAPRIPADQIVALRVGPVLLKENSHDILSRCHPRSLVGVSHHVPVAADVSHHRAHRACCVVNGCGTRETGVYRAPQPGPPLLGTCRE